MENFKNNLYKIRKIQDQIAEEYNVELIDTISNMDRPEFYRDGCHLTDEGYKQLAIIIAEVLQGKAD